MTKNFETLVDWFKDKPSVIVALSGGVDSALVAAGAVHALSEKAVAVTADYKTLSAEELSSAINVAKEIGIRHRIIEYNELENPEFIKNDNLRCYHCRTELVKHLREESNRACIALIVDGTNADDLLEYRPGIKAMHEAGIKSPLLELGFTKSDVRYIAKEIGLSIHDKPSNACLASRLPIGQQVTLEKLSRIEQAEIAVKSITGIRQVRVRDHEGLARIEVGREELPKILDASRLAMVDRALRTLGYHYVTLDTAGYKTGGLVVINNETFGARVQNANR